MSDLNRFLELAGVKELSHKVKQLDEYSLSELQALKADLESEIKGALFISEKIKESQYTLNNVNRFIEAIKKNPLNEMLRKVDGKWALVSKSTGKPLRYYKGEGKPSDEWVKSQEKSIQYFKNMGEGNYDFIDELPEDRLDEVAPEDQEDFVKSAKSNFKKRYGKRWKKVLYATAWKKHNESITDNGFEISDSLYEKFTGSKITEAPLAVSTVPNLFSDEMDKHTENQKEFQDATGATQDKETPLNAPADVLKMIDQRIAELKDSMETYDKTTFVQHYSNKQKAVDSLEFIKEKLKKNNVEGFKQAHIHYDSLASIYSQLFPQKLIDFLHDGMASLSTEVDFSDRTNKKVKEKDVVQNAIYKPLDTSVYPQKNKKITEGAHTSGKVVLTSREPTNLTPSQWAKVVYREFGGKVTIEKYTEEELKSHPNHIMFAHDENGSPVAGIAWSNDPPTWIDFRWK